MELIKVADLTCDYLIRDRLGRRTKKLRAIDSVSLTISRGEILGLVGETGCGKSTLAKVIAGITKPITGTVEFAGETIISQRQRLGRVERSRLQYVYQDPGASLDPRWKLLRSLHEPLLIHTRLNYVGRLERIQRVTAALDLAPDLLERYPHQLSGGQQRRMGLARILVIAPEVILFDEPTSGLDVIVQSSVIKLLGDLRREFQLSYLLISHDISVVEAICDRIAVMYRGRIVEIGPTDEVLNRPRHPYTRTLFGASLRVGTRRPVASRRETRPSSSKIIGSTGCAYYSDCSVAIPACSLSPQYLIFDEAHGTACLHVKGPSLHSSSRA